jgi:hypothetical protein
MTKGETLMEHELRYRGELLGFHPSREAAESHAREHHGYGRKPNEPRQAQHHVQDPESITIEPRRPITLFVSGNLVDSFMSREDGEVAIDRLMKNSKRGRVTRITVNLCELVAGTKPSPIPEPAAYGT